MSRRWSAQASVYALLILSAVACRGKKVAPPAAPADSPTPTPAAPPARRDPVVTPPPATPAPTPRRAPVVSETAPEPAREFRGVWVASVANIDWPSSRTLSTEQQQQELIELLDRAATLKLNAIIFQVRPAADALYASTIEPWSEYLTGAQGVAPSPFWDPLEFAIRESHKRGMELHAWFNPYRARHTGRHSPLAKNHIARTNPSLVKKYGDYLWMDPGEKAVRDRTVRVVLDVVKRYDVDGIHIDDYFYPYPEINKRKREIPFPDDVSWKKYQRAGGKLARDDWRRENVNLLVHALDSGVHAVKPWVKFGISPFGIWRPGYPSQIRGLDAYQKLYADARKWLHEGWLDYFTPQLYWPTTKAEQSYPVLLQWWSDENKQARHLWPGNFTSRAAGRGASAFSVGELVEQIRVTRLQTGASGNVHFSMKSFLINQGSMNDSLIVGPYAEPALIPASPWLSSTPVPTPSLLLGEGAQSSTVTLGTYGKAAPWQWLVQVRTSGGWLTRVMPGSVTSFQLPPTGASKVTVRAVNRVGVESPPISISLTDRGRSDGR